MNDIFLILVLLSLPAIVVGAIKPRWVMPWAATPKRLPAIGLYCAVLVASFVAFGVTSEPQEVATAEADATEQAAQEAPAQEQAATQEPETAGEPEQADDQPAAVAQDTPPQRWLDMDRSEETQAERQALIQRAIEMGLIYKVEKPTKYPRIYVDSGWNALRFDEKQNLANMITTYYYAQDHEANMAFIRDGFTGKDIGRLDSSGLRLN